MSSKQILFNIKFVINSDGTRKGHVVGSRRCQLICCRGQCLGVRWPDGRLTWPCTMGMKSMSEDTLKIGWVYGG